MARFFWADASYPTHSRPRAQTQRRPGQRSMRSTKPTLSSFPPLRRDELQFERGENLLFRLAGQQSAMLINTVMRIEPAPERFSPLTQENVVLLAAGAGQKQHPEVCGRLSEQILV